MPLSGTLTKAHIIDPVTERNGFTRKNYLMALIAVIYLIFNTPMLEAAS
jgi:hypothetical protein